jgi:hypothetical protein
MDDDKKAKDDDTLEKNTIRMIVKFRAYKSLESRSEELVIPKSLNIKEVALLAFKHYFPEVPNPPPDHIRVCRYDQDLEVIENSFDDPEQPFTYCLKHPPPKTNNECLILQVKNEDDFFPQYDAEGWLSII